MINLPLSDRLLACCQFVHPGDRVADVGCDHGYLGIYLLLQGTASAVLASDLREKPLEKARVNSEKYGVRDKMEFFLSDGLKTVSHNFDTLVCAGMGGDTMVSILTHAPWMKNPRYRMILQCQTKAHILRKYLSQNGWTIREELVLRDGHFLYTVMEVIFSPVPQILSPGQYFLSPAMLSHKSTEVSEYYFRITKKIRISVTNRGAQAEPMLAAALSELEELGSRPEYLWLKEVTL